MKLDNCKQIKVGNHAFHHLSFSHLLYTVLHEDIFSGIGFPNIHTDQTRQHFSNKMMFTMLLLFLLGLFASLIVANIEHSCNCIDDICIDAEGIPPSNSSVSAIVNKTTSSFAKKLKLTFNTHITVLLHRPS